MPVIEGTGEADGSTRPAYRVLRGQVPEGYVARLQPGRRYVLTNELGDSVEFADGEIGWDPRELVLQVRLHDWAAKASTLREIAAAARKAAEYFEAADRAGFVLLKWDEDGVEMARGRALEEIRADSA